MPGVPADPHSDIAPYLADSLELREAGRGGSRRTHTHDEERE